jgi:hypothetical protein
MGGNILSSGVESSKRGVLTLIAVRRTWLIPILYYIHSYGGLSLDELREITGLKSKVLRRALWWLLKKYSIVEESGTKFIVKREYADVLDTLFMNYCIIDKRHIFRLGGTYFVVSIKRSRVTSYTVPAELIEKLHELQTNIESEFQPLDLSQALGIPLNLAKRVVQTYKLLRECWKK